MTKPESSLGIEGAVSVAETASSASPALPMGESQAGKKMPRPNSGMAFGVLNPYGDVWSHDHYDTPEEAAAHLAEFWKHTPEHNRGFKIIPVEVTVSAICTDDLTPASEASPLGAEPDATGIAQGRDEQRIQPSHDDEGLIERLNGEADLIDVGMNMDDGDTIEVLRQAANTISRLKGERDEAQDDRNRLLRRIDEIAEWVRAPLHRSVAGIHSGSDQLLVVKAHRWKSFLKKLAPIKARALLSPRLVGVEGDEVITSPADPGSAKLRREGEG